MGQYGLSQGGIFSLQWELVYKTDKIHHEFKVFSRKKLSKLMILVVLLCPLYSIVYPIFKKQKNNQNGLCEHLLAHAYAIHIFLLEHKLKQC